MDVAISGRSAGIAEVAVQLAAESGRRVVTIAGVGYGDHYPVTLVGRLVGVGLMIGGIARIGVIAAALAVLDASRSATVWWKPNSSRFSTFVPSWRP